MKIAIMQPYTFPYIGYFQLIYACDVFVFYNDVNFIKKGFVNKNYILNQGQRTAFTIPCKAISQNKKINKTEISLTSEFTFKFIKTLEYSYKKAPFYNDVFPLLKNYLTHFNGRTISDFAISSILLVCNYIGLEKKFKLSSKAYDNSDLKKEYRLKDIALKENSEVYINTIGGKTLYSKERFFKEGIELKFLESNDIEYKQFNEEFVPWLSIIDVMMFNDKKTILDFLKQYKLT